MSDSSNSKSDHGNHAANGAGEQTVQVRNNSVGVRVSIGSRGNEARPEQPQQPEEIRPSFPSA
jgi:hypothetical protein